MNPYTDRVGLSLSFTEPVNLTDLGALSVVWALLHPEKAAPVIEVSGHWLLLQHEDIKALVAFIEYFHGRGWEVTKT